MSDSMSESFSCQPIAMSELVAHRSGTPAPTSKQQLACSSGSPPLPAGVDVDDDVPQPDPTPIQPSNTISTISTTSTNLPSVLLPTHTRTSASGSPSTRTVTPVPPPALGEKQRQMVKMLHQALDDRMQIHLAFLPAVWNSHAVIVCQNRALPEHRLGLPVVRHWANHFEL